MRTTAHSGRRLPSIQGAALYLSIFYNPILWAIVLGAMVIGYGVRIRHIRSAKLRTRAITPTTTPAVQAARSYIDEEYDRAKRGLAHNKPLLAAMLQDRHVQTSVSLRNDERDLRALVERQEATVALVDAQRAREQGSEQAATV